MTVTFERVSARPITIHVWFDVYAVEEGEGKERIGTFETVDEAVEFARDENRVTKIEVEYA